MRFHSLEAFRGLAALMIVLFHSPFYSSQEYSKFIIGGHIFVDFFFVLSGFIMAYAYSNNIGNTVTAKMFFIKRFSRIYPLHLFTLLIWVPYLLMKHLIYIDGGRGSDPFITNDLVSFITNLFLIQSWGFQSELTWNAPSWSISTEFFAYILFYLLFYLLHKSSKQIKIATITVLFLILNIIQYLYAYHFGDFTLLINCVSSFLGGILIYFLWLKRLSFQSKIMLNSLEVVIIILLIFSVSNLSSLYMHKYVITLLFMATVYLFSMEGSGIISDLLKHRYFQLMGLLSYSIYMIHFLIIDILRGLFQHILKVPVNSQHGFEIIVLPYAVLLNSAILITVITVSYFTYSKLEQPARNKLNKKLI